MRKKVPVDISLILIFAVILFGIFLRERSFSMIFLVLAWGILCITGIHREEHKKEEIFSMKCVSSLRGICAIEIMIGHIGVQTGNAFLFLNRKAGILFVGIFFMLSGYGLAYNVNRKNHYLDNFLKKRLSKLLVPVAIVCASVVLVNRVFFRTRVTTTELLSFFNSSSWFVWEIIVLYLVFYIAYSRVGGNGKKAVLIFSAIFSVFAYAVKMSNPWYGSTLCFPLGIYFYDYAVQAKNKQNNLRGKYIAEIGLALLAVVCGIGLYFMLGEDNFAGTLIGRNVASAAFCIVIILLLEKIAIGNSAAAWLGIFSYEIYLVHPFVIVLVDCMKINSIYVYSVAVIAITILVSIVIHKISYTILRCIGAY